MNQSHEQSDSIMKTPKPLMSQTLYLLNPLTYDHETLHVQSTLHLEKEIGKSKIRDIFPDFLLVGILSRIFICSATAS